MSRVSQSEIAKKLGISRTTVTKALNDDPLISNLTKTKVKATANELGYIANNIGRSLANKRTMTIGLVIPKIAHSFYSSMLESIYNAAYQRGYDIVPMVSFEDDKRESKMIKNLLAMSVDGIILDISVKTKSWEAFDIIVKNNIPLIFLDRALEGHKFSQINTNDSAVTYEIINYAINKGYNKFGFLGGKPNLSSGMDRLKGFKRALRDNNIPIVEEWIRTGGYSKDFGYQHLMEMNMNSSLPELVFCVSDEVAIGVYKAMEELKKEIPKDLAVIGFGDLEIARYLTPSLTTVSMPVKEMADAAIDVLLSEIEDRKKKTTMVKIKGSMVIRNSI